MGFKVDFGGNDNDNKPHSMAEEGTYTADLLGFKPGLSPQKGTPFIRPVFGNFDGLLDTEGKELPNSWKVDVDWGVLTFYITPTAMWKLKKFASDLGVELPDGETEYDSLEDYAEEMSDAFEGSYSVTVSHVPDRNDPNRVYAKVTAVS